MAEFEIKVTELDASGKEYSFPLRAAWLADQLTSLGDAAYGLSPPEKDGSLQVTAQMMGADVIVRGRLRGGLLAECSRCLGPALIPVDVDVTTLLTSRGVREIVDSDDLSPDEMDREFFTGDVVDLSQLVREHLLLEVPMQPLCRADCPGIAPRVPREVALAGWDAKPAIDPRLAPLAAIQLPASNEAPSAAPKSAHSAPKKRSKRSH